MYRAKRTGRVYCFALVWRYYFITTIIERFKCVGPHVLYMSENAEFILGFIAGEGSFQVDLQKRPSRSKYNVTVRPHFSLLVHEKKILDDIQSKIGGKIYENSPEYRLDIRSINESKTLIRLVESTNSDFFKITDKYEQYLGWKRVVGFKDNDITKEEVKKSIEIAYDIGKPDKRKHNKEYYLNAVSKSGDYTCGAETKKGTPCKRHVATPNGRCQHHKN